MWTYIGPFGNLLQIKCPIVGVAAPITRIGSEQFTLDGYRFVQRATVALRSWNITIDLATPDDIKELMSLEYGVYGPPPWKWYNPEAAYINILTPWLSAPGIPGPKKWITGSMPNPLVYPGPNILEVPAAALQATSPSIPVLPGHSYVASVNLLDRPGGTTEAILRLRWVDAAGVQISQINGSTTTSPNRAVVTGTAPVNAAGAVLILDPTTATTGRFGSVQLREGTADANWNVGMGVESISIATGLQQTLQEVYDEVRAGVIRQITTTLLEVQSA